MAVVATHLLDTSVSARMSQAAVSEILVPLITAGLVATCGALDFEALYSARSSHDYDRIRRDRALAYEYLPTDDRDWRRALDVQRELARSGMLRSVGMPDLLIAAVAERERVVILHHDRDFDTIASFTGQATAWVESN